MSSVDAPMSERFPMFDVEVGNELFYCIFDGEPMARYGFMQLDDDKPGLGLPLKTEFLVRPSGLAPRTAPPSTDAATCCRHRR